MQCRAKIKSGPNKGRRCSCRAKQDGLCGRHCIKPECCICLTTGISVTEVRSLRCSHKFHDECIQKWLRITPSCPMCRVPMIRPHSRNRSRSANLSNPASVTDASTAQQIELPTGTEVTGHTLRDGYRYLRSIPPHQTDLSIREEASASATEETPQITTAYQSNERPNMLKRILSFLCCHVF